MHKVKANLGSYVNQYPIPYIPKTYSLFWLMTIKKWTCVFHLLSAAIQPFLNIWICWKEASSQFLNNAVSQIGDSQQFLLGWCTMHNARTAQWADSRGLHMLILFKFLFMWRKYHFYTDKAYLFHWGAAYWQTPWWNPCCVHLCVWMPCRVCLCVCGVVSSGTRDLHSASAAPPTTPGPQSVTPSRCPGSTRGHWRSYWGQRWISCHATHRLRSHWLNLHLDPAQFKEEKISYVTL